MKETFTTYLCFLPSDYNALKKYLEQKLEEGYRLKWIKGGFGGFIKNENTDFRYVIDPYANMNLVTLKRLSKFRLNTYTENGWFFLGKTHGNYIFFANNQKTEDPNLEENAKECVISSELSRHSAFIAIAIFIFYTSLNSKMFMYAYTLTNLYIYLSVILGFLCITSIGSVLILIKEKARVLSKTDDDDYKKATSRGTIISIRNIGLSAIAVLYFLNEIQWKPIILLFVLLPIIVMLIGSLAIKKIAAKDPENASKNILPVVVVCGGIIAVLIMTSLTSIQKTNASLALQNSMNSLEKAETLPVLRYSDFFENSDFSSRTQENNSVLGENYILSESDEDGNIVFSNHTKTINDFTAKKIMEYLFAQSQIDYNGTFENIHVSGNNIYKIIDKNAYLLRVNNTVILVTVEGDVDSDVVLQKISEMIQHGNE